MAIHPKSYFQTLFVPGYILPASVARDLCDSILFYSDGIGYKSDFTAVVSPPIAISDIDLSSTNLFFPPNFYNQNPVTCDLSDNVIFQWTIPFSWTFLTTLDVHANALTSFIIDSNLIVLATLDVSTNLLNSFSVSQACGHIASINASHNQLTDFLTYIDWIHLASLDLSDNALNFGGINHVLEPLLTISWAVTIDLSGGTNLSHSLWSPDALLAETAIIAAGGSVISNP